MYQPVRVLCSPPGKRFAYDGDRPTDSCVACTITDEAMDMASASSVQNVLPRSAAIATGNPTGKPQAFPGTHNRPPHLQMMWRSWPSQDNVHANCPHAWMFWRRSDIRKSSVVQHCSGSCLLNAVLPPMRQCCRPPCTKPERKMAERKHCFFLTTHKSKGSVTTARTWIFKHFLLNYFTVILIFYHILREFDF